IPSKRAQGLYHYSLEKASETKQRHSKRILFVCLFSIFRPSGCQCLLPWWLRPCYFLTRFAGQFSNYMIACSIAPALFSQSPRLFTHLMYNNHSRDTTNRSIHKYRTIHP
ncbi:BgTH12-06448, partial [Blumeria graminis f. sp. triticale]